MMFREATVADEAQIIDLLQQSLGNESTQKSIEFWRWKHVHNPFGPSPVLLAVDRDRVVGVRAFMRWQWVEGSRTYRALRAVDTATHPDYRGQGVFKKLTLRLIEQCEAAGDDFIFNTPNEQSRPGYLKMGWRELGKVPLCLAPYSPINMLGHLLLSRPYRPPLQIRLASKDDFASLPKPTTEVGTWRTPVTPAILRWRYADCPVRNYAALTLPTEFCIVYYLREQRMGQELRIVHDLVRPGSEGLARAALSRLLRRVKPAVVTAAPAAWLPWYFTPALPLGLNLTFRSLNLADPVALPSWHYTLGDLELF